MLLQDEGQLSPRLTHIIAHHTATIPYNQITTCKEVCLTGGGLEGAEPLADASSSEDVMSPPTELPTTLLHSLASPPSFKNKTEGG